MATAAPAPPTTPSRPATPAMRGRLLRLVLPVLVAVIAVAFAGRFAATGGPDASAVAAAAADPCGVLSLQEMGVLVGATFRDSVVDLDGPFAVCAYLGMAESGTDVVEVGVASPEALARAEGTRAGRAARRVFGAAVEGVDGVHAVAGLGDEAALLPVGVGEVWTRAGAVLLRVSVTRTGTVGDADAAAAATRGLLTKLARPVP
jgi:hypothetical protein